MVRRTKEASLETRRVIIDAARAMFDRHGVARTSMEQIAAAAGVTRGAIYWHFANKADLFYAMRDQVHMPLIDLSHIALDAADETTDPLARIEAFLAIVVGHVASDDTTQCTFRIANFKCEYVDAFAHDLDVAYRKHADLRAKLAKVYRQAQRRGSLRHGLSPALAATDTMVFLSGLMRIWLFDEDGRLVQAHARKLIAQHIDAKRDDARRPPGDRAPTVRQGVSAVARVNRSATT